ncbi:polysaccharide deacetylase family protein [Sphingomonas sp. H39-1-10]|uniref:polysaccharide deacetylase family protein n=1 Tax=Sphingomonas TaxID=13687 RepID=UPI000880683E|nr:MULTISPECIES: polysaccharide deacetylase family protein [Sphingomonas]MDF0488735.1 polysaccharide deacetylase family protein [Sphingomonas pollutisoli]SDA13116.1 Polysaccharide deacetylase [Sphingomonas sp. NFR15]
MAEVLVTIDTELSSRLHRHGASLGENLARSIAGKAGDAAYGVGWQMDMLERAGLKAVFFVDPMPALAHGSDFLAPMIAPMLARGHEVQLHSHTEWLEWASHAPVGGRARNIGDFDLAEQITVLTLARDLLTSAGAPRPTAFRAGNYGADDRTIAALATLGIRWDSSVNIGCPDDSCRVSRKTHAPVDLGGVVELPVSGLLDRPGHFRPAQICALSGWEMRAALRHAAAGEAPFVIVTHSFEMLSRDRERPNRMVMRRFRAMCEEIARHPGLQSVGFRDLDPAEVLARSRAERPLLAANRVRTAGRMVEQAIATALYERPARPSRA